MARKRRRRPRPGRRLTRAERIAEEHRYKLSLLRSFVAKHGWSELRAGTVVRDVKLFTWVRRCRYRYSTGEIADWLIGECESIPGWSWDPKRDRNRRSLDALRTFIRYRGWEALHVETVVDRICLAWRMSHWRMERRRRRLDRWIIDALEAIPGWSWDPRTTNYATKLRELRGHAARHGLADLRQETRSRNGVAIGKWANHIRMLRRQRKLARWLESALDTIPGWSWDPRRELQDARVAMVQRYVATHDVDALTHDIVVRGVALGRWVHNCRWRHATGTLSAQTTTALEAIPGWRWSSANPRRA